jgi:hypothetical protein
MTDKLRGPMSLPSSAASGQVQARHFAGLFLLSLATLLLELALTRVLSVSLWYHFGFLVISTALLGFGASGVTLALWTGLREKIVLDLGLGACGLAFAVSVVFSFWCMQRIPFDPFSVAVDHRQLLFMPIYFLLVALPFFCSGLAISLLLTRGSKAINRLYGFDLLGAGAGCALVALVIPRFGGQGAYCWRRLLERCQRCVLHGISDGFLPLQPHLSRWCCWRRVLRETRSSQST